MEQVNVYVCIIADSVPDLTVKLSFLLDCEWSFVFLHLCDIHVSYVCVSGKLELHFLSFFFLFPNSSLAYPLEK